MELQDVFVFLSLLTTVFLSATRQTQTYQLVSELEFLPTFQYFLWENFPRYKSKTAARVFVTQQISFNPSPHHYTYAYFLLFDGICICVQRNLLNHPLEHNSMFGVVQLIYFCFGCMCNPGFREIWNLLVRTDISLQHAKNKHVINKQTNRATMGIICVRGWYKLISEDLHGAVGLWWCDFWVCVWLNSNILNIDISIYKYCI